MPNELDWSEPGYNVPSASDDERLADLAHQSERLSGRPARAEVTEDDLRYLVQEVDERARELEAWERWYAEAPSSIVSAAWYEQAPARR